MSAIASPMTEGFERNLYLSERKNTMSKIRLTLLLVALACALSGCGDSSSQPSKSETSPPQTRPALLDKPAGSPSPEEKLQPSPDRTSESKFETPQEVYAAALAAQAAGDSSAWIQCFDEESLDLMLGSLVHELSGLLPKFEKSGDNHPAAAGAKRLRETLNKHQLNEEAISKLGLAEMRSAKSPVEVLGRASKAVDDKAACLVELVATVRETKFPSRTIPTYSGNLNNVQLDGDTATAVTVGGARVHFRRRQSAWLLHVPAGP